MNEDIQSVFEETTSEMGTTDAAYVRLLQFFQSNGTLLVPPRVIPGQLVFFTYRPTSESFINRNQFYDKYPLVVVTKAHKDGFEGVNLHFLSPKWREVLFTNMMESIPQTTPSREEWLTRFRINKNTLSSSSRFKLYKPCFRRYLKSGMRRRPVVIPFDFWNETVQAKLEGFMRSGNNRKRVARPTVFTNTYRRFIKET